MIELFCKGLPKELSNQIYNEYQSRLSEIKYIVQTRESYTLLQEHYKTVELILALSVFYKRVIANLNAATMFATKIFNNSDATAIRIGTFDLNDEERRRMLAITIHYRRILKTYEIPKSMFDYVETKELLRNIRQFKIRQDNKETKNNDGEPL